jgi:hypothetical protein
VNDIELAPHLYIPDDKPFLEGFQGIFNAVYIALHPFFRVSGNNTAPVHLDSGKAEGASNVTYAERRHAEVLRIDGLAKSSGERVPWSQVQSDCSFLLLTLSMQYGQAHRMILKPGK